MQTCLSIYVSFMAAGGAQGQGWVIVTGTGGWK